MDFFSDNYSIACCPSFMNLRLGVATFSNLECVHANRQLHNSNL